MFRISVPANPAQATDRSQFAVCSPHPSSSGLAVDVSVQAVMTGTLAFAQSGKPFVSLSCLS